MGKSPLYPFHRRQGKPQSWSGLSKKTIIPAENQALATQPVAHYYTDCTMLVWRLQGSLNYILVFYVFKTMDMIIAWPSLLFFSKEQNHSFTIFIHTSHIYCSYYRYDFLFKSVLPTSQDTVRLSNFYCFKWRGHMLPSFPCKGRKIIMYPKGVCILWDIKQSL